MKTVVVTGAGGFIGSHVVETLLATDTRVIALYRTDPPPFTAPNLQTFPLDLLDENELRAVLRYAAPNAHTVIHTAAMDGNAAFKRDNTALIFDTNLRIGSNVLNCARDSSVENVVLVSSAEASVESDNGYALSKSVVELLAEQYRKQYGMRIFLPRPSNVYGPRDKLDRVIPAMITRIASGQDVEIWGDGSQTRSFVHVHDVVAAILGMVDSEIDALTVATRETISILELARTLCALLDVPERVRLDLTKPTGAPARAFDTTRMYELVTPRPLRQGLGETVSWYRSTLPLAA
ncbi:NAD-dependent epimerase/dehydratase family protein [Lentzea terrae]|uniref:NAD-dependent epimerase/dehydratase family protein n=1 Tax=Lentzea terrae TaxID=2200761 RepID=UPI000DD2F4A8|nr:NAD-dependent epimerase/dehydratase family protein [Lentzea terrae]